MRAPSLTAGGTWLGVMTWGLAFHIAAVMLLFGVVGLPAEVVRAIAAWKELLVLLLLAYAAARLSAGRLPPSGVQAPDLAVAALIGIVLLHALAVPAGLARHALDGVDLGYAVRDLVFFLLLYVVGRATPEITENTRALHRLVVVGVVVSVVAVVEWFVATPELLVLLGAANYFGDFLGTAEFTQGNVYGLPDNYWTTLGGRLVQRAGSVFMSSQGFALPFLIFVPAATVWMSFGRRWRSAPALAAYAVLWLGLLLSITRMTILACGLQVMLLILLARRPSALVALAGVGMTLAAGAMLLLPGVAAFVWETLTWQTGSSASHSKDWSNGLEALWRHPLGNGLGTTDQTAARIGLEPLTADNLYLKYGVEAGVPAMLVFMALLAMLAWIGARAALYARNPIRRAYGGFLAAAVLGVVVNGITAVHFNAPMLAYPFFWLAGSIVSIRRRDIAPPRLARSPVPTRG